MMRSFFGGVLFAGSMLLQACHSTAPADNRLLFRPDSTKIYIIRWQQQTSSYYTTSDTVRRTESETMKLQFQWLGSRDSLYVMKLVFLDVEKRVPSLAVRFNGVKTVTVQDSIVTPQNIKNNALNQWQYRRSLLKGLSLQVWMNNKGEVVKTEGFDKLVDSVTARSGNDRREVKRTLEEDAGDGAMRDRLTRLFAFVPARPKAPKDNWVNDLLLLKDAPILLSNMYVLQSLRHDTAIITISGVVSARQGERGRVYMKGYLRGSIMASYASGMPYHYTDSSETAPFYESENGVRPFMDDVLVTTKKTVVTLQSLPRVKTN